MRGGAVKARDGPDCDGPCLLHPCAGYSSSEEWRKCWNRKVVPGRWTERDVPSERFTGLAAVLDAIRNDDGITQPILVERIGLGRSVVAQRVAELEAAGLVASNGLG